MKEENWQLLAKLMAKETNADEDNKARRLLDSDKKFQRAFFAIEEIWSEIKTEQNSFDKERIIELIEKQISRNKRINSYFSISRILKYAAIFIGIIVGVYVITSNLNKTSVVTANNNIIENYSLPDGSTITLNQGATIQYSTSFITGFNREVTITKGEAFFEISKISGKGFTVHTPDYDVNVLGTKFNINIDRINTSIVLTEGSVILDNLTNSNIEMEMIPGELVSCTHDGKSLPLKETVNTTVYTLWTEHKLQFKNFTMKDMEEVFRKYFNKTLIINDKYIEKVKLGGSAPIDDLNLILEGLSSVLNRKIVLINDSIIINKESIN